MALQLAALQIVTAMGHYNLRCCGIVDHCNVVTHGAATRLVAPLCRCKARCCYATTRVIATLLCCCGVASCVVVAL